MKTIEITTDDQLQEFASNSDQPTYFATDASGASFVVAATEDGDLIVTRPAWEDDRLDDGTFPEGVTYPIDGLELPVTVYDLSGPNLPEPDRFDNPPMSRWSIPDGHVVADHSTDGSGVFFYRDPHRRDVIDPALLSAALQAATDEVAARATAEDLVHQED